MEFKPCSNPECERLISLRVLYCCNACSVAHEGKFELHESGPFGHSDYCNRRWLERSKKRVDEKIS